MVDEEAGGGVRLAFERYATGEYADFQIAELLRSEGYEPLAGARPGNVRSQQRGEPARVPTRCGLAETF